MLSRTFLSRSSNPGKEILYSFPSLEWYFFDKLFGWGLCDEDTVEKRIGEVIDTNIEMHEFVEEGLLSAGDIGKFLTIAYKLYEAY